MRIIIDRLEDEIAVCELEDGTMVEHSIKDLPMGIREGDILYKNSKDGSFQVEKEERLHLEEEMKHRMEQLFQKKKK